MEKKILVYGVYDDRLYNLKSHISDFGYSIVEVPFDCANSLVKDLVDGNFNEKNSTKIDMEFLLFVNIKDDELYNFLAKLRENKLYFPHKAILTQTNMNWSLIKLLSENKEEHAVMTVYGNLRRALALAEKFKKENKCDKDLEELVEIANDYFHPREFDFEELKTIYNNLAAKLNSITVENLKDN